MSPTNTVSLNIIIVGAGIAGFAAAAAFRRAGHNVHIYERSSLNNEIGAAIHVPPNASRELLKWGLDPVKSRFVVCQSSFRANGTSLERFHESDEKDTAEVYGAPRFFAHRVDLHNALKRLALDEGEGKPAVIHLRSGVKDYYPETGTVSLSDGTVVTGDLIVAADGVHTKAAEVIMGRSTPAIPTGRFAYRFLIPTSEIVADPQTAYFVQTDDGSMKFFVNKERRIVSYPCRNNEEHNFVGVFDDDKVELGEDWNVGVDQNSVLERFHDFHPDLLAILSKANDIKQWPLLYRAPVSSWHKEKLVLVGDAAHPMLPHQGQGGAQAIEDGIALGVCFSDISTFNPEVLEKRLQIYEKIRMNRASMIQIFSNAGQDQAELIQEEASKYMDADKVPKNPEEFMVYNFGYDVVEDSKQMLLRDLSV